MTLLNSVTVPLLVPHVFPLGLHPGLEMEVVNVSLVLLIQVVIWGNGSGLPEKTRPGIFSHEQSRSRASNAEEMENIAPPFL